MNSKTISKIVVSALPAICVTTYSVSDCHAGELLREIQSEQRKLPYATQNQVMQNVFKDYDKLNIEVKEILTTIWHNDAGNLLLRRLHNVIKNDTQKLTILWDAYDEDEETNLFRYETLTIFLNKNEFGDYVGYSEDRIYPFPEQLDTVIFHELCHALHHFEGKMVCKQRKVIPTFYKLSKNEKRCKMTCDAWKNDEEIHAINGWHIDNDGTLKFDWLNTNSYIILEELKKGTPPKEILQRVFHCDYPKYRMDYQGVVIEHFDEFVIPLGKHT